MKRHQIKNLQTTMKIEDIVNILYFNVIINTNHIF
jgi:hypothetical protein